MNIGLSNKIRDLAQAKYVNPAIMAGKQKFSIRVRDVLGDLQSEGFPGGHTPQICSALRTSKFLRENGLEIENIEGPPSKTSPTVVFTYRIARKEARALAVRAHREQIAELPGESPSDRALRLTEKLRGILKEEFAAYGGGEAFLRWVRSEDEDAE
jgi:hypothetical protein